MADRITQVPVEVAVEPTDAEGRITQVPVEVAVEPTTANARITQVPVEVAVDVSPPVRVSSEPVEVLVKPTNVPVRVSGEPVEVLVKPINPPMRVSSMPVEVLRSTNKVTLVSDSATATVAMPSVGLSLAYVVGAATGSVEATGAQTSHEYTVSVYNVPVEAVAPTLEYTFTVPTIDATAPTGGDVGLSHNYSVSGIDTSVEMPDVGLAINPNVNLVWDVATATVLMPNVGITIEDEVEPTPTPGGVGPQIIIDRDEELFGLLTLRVNPATCHVGMVPPAITYYKSKQSRLQKLYRPIFPQKPASFAIHATPVLTLKVGPPPNHYLFTVRPQHRLVFGVESMSVQFSDRSSALWGDIRRDVPRETQALLDLGVSRSLISDTIPTARRLKRRT